MRSDRGLALLIGGLFVVGLCASCGHDLDAAVEAWGSDHAFSSAVEDDAQKLLPSLHLQTVTVGALNEAVSRGRTALAKVEENGDASKRAVCAVADFANDNGGTLPNPDSSSDMQEVTVDGLFADISSQRVRSINSAIRALRKPNSVSTGVISMACVSDDILEG
jgi:hypothetical protein